MIVDSSAIMAILLEEPEQERFATALFGSVQNRIAAGNWVELAAIITRHPDKFLYAAFEQLVAEYSIVVEPMSVGQAQIGHQAYRDFGRGTGHPARLNFGDCFAYALAKDTEEPLLFKGDDFRRTDVEPAL